MAYRNQKTRGTPHQFVAVAANNLEDLGEASDDEDIAPQPGDPLFFDIQKIMWKYIDLQTVTRKSSSTTAHLNS